MKIFIIADTQNHRIVKWNKNKTVGEIVAGGNGQGDKTNQLSFPSTIAIDRQNKFLFICDFGNKRIVQWPLENGTFGKIIISDIDCSDLAIDNNDYLYVSEQRTAEIRKWKIGGRKEGILVADGNVKGNGLNQLFHPTSIFVDENYSIYISDSSNYRVMKWKKGTKEGVIIAGGQGDDDSFKQCSPPGEIFVDQFETLYVVDIGNNRVVRWLKGAKQGDIIAGEGSDRGVLKYNGVQKSLPSVFHLFITQ